MRSRTSRNFPRSAFTLFEILAVVTILLIVSALFFPLASQMLRAAKSVACLGNLRSYGNAVLSFAADQGGSLPSWDGSSTSGNGNTIPQFGAWTAPYLGYTPGSPAELRCPLVQDRKKTGFFYSGNAGLCRYYPGLRGIPAPSSRIVLAAECYGRDYFYVPGHFNRTIWGNGDGGTDPAQEGSVRPPQYHLISGRRGLNMFFLDGHAALIAPTDDDWSEPPTYGDATNGGYFYHIDQFSKMQSGKLRVQ